MMCKKKKSLWSIFKTSKALLQGMKTVLMIAQRRCASSTCGVFNIFLLMLGWYLTNWHHGCTERTDVTLSCASASPSVYNRSLCSSSIHSFEIGCAGAVSSHTGEALVWIFCQITSCKLFLIVADHFKTFPQFVTMRIIVAMFIFAHVSMPCKSLAPQD